MKKESRTSLIKRFFIIVIVSDLIILSVFLGLFAREGSMTGFAVSDFADYRVYIIDAYQGKDVTFIIPVDNGDEEIRESYAEITIYDSEDNEVAFLTTDKINIAANEKSELKARWSGSGHGEDYQARILIFNDDESYSFSKNFKLEKETLTFESVIVQEFKLGGVVNLSAVIQNHLDERLEDVSISILILDESDNTLSEILSEKKGIDGESISKFEIIWDTKGIEPDRYNAKMMINYGENFLDRDLIINIQDGDFSIVGVGYSIAKQSVQKSKTNYSVFLLACLFVLVNMAWIIYYIRTKKRLKRH